MEGGRGGQARRHVEVNESPMRCQGLLTVRCEEWEKQPEREGEWLD